MSLNLDLVRGQFLALELQPVNTEKPAKVQIKWFQRAGTGRDRMIALHVGDEGSNKAFRTGAIILSRPIFLRKQMKFV